MRSLARRVELETAAGIGDRLPVAVEAHTDVAESLDGRPAGTQGGDEGRTAVIGPPGWTKKAGKLAANASRAHLGSGLMQS